MWHVVSIPPIRQYLSELGSVVVRQLWIDELDHFVG